MKLSILSLFESCALYALNQLHKGAVLHNYAANT